jgi:transposase
MLSLEALFCKIDDFCQAFEAQWTQRLLSDGLRQRQRQRSMSLSEIVTILVMFHQQGYRNFKTYYHNHVSVYWRAEFPTLVSYSRLIEYLPSVLLPLCAYLRHCFGICRGISFIDSTAIHVCRPQRAHQHRVFQGLAAWGKTSMGWFFGLKLHLVVNAQGELLDCCLTPGNTDDRKPVRNLLKDCWGKVFADRGYVSKALAAQLWQDYGLRFLAKPRRNMKNSLMRMSDKFLARRRSLVETVIDQLKNRCQIEHSRHRSPVSCFVHLLSGLIAYCHQPKKPTLDLAALGIELPA